MDCEGVSFTADWFSPHALLWRRHLAHLVGRPDPRFLEVGCFEGRASTRLPRDVLTHPTARIDCVDTFEGRFEHHAMDLDLPSPEARFDRNIPACDGAARVAKLKGRSSERLRGLTPGT